MKIDTKELRFEKLNAEIIPELLDLQEEAFAVNTGSPDFLRRNTYDTLEVCFHGKSLVLGAYYGDVLAGFGILFDAGNGTENLAKDVEIIEDKLTSANVKLIIVKHEFRGNGIQRLLIGKLEEYAKSLGYNWLCATVAPVNNWSLDNFIKCDFKEYKVLQKYGGLSRILLCKKI